MYIHMYIYLCIYICIHLIKRFLRFFSTIVKRDPIHGERTPPKSRLLSKVSRVPIPWHTVDRYLIGGIHAPLKNISQIGSSSQLLGEIKKKVPNHQPGIILTTEPNNSRLSQAAKKMLLINQSTIIDQLYKLYSHMNPYVLIIETHIRNHMFSEQLNPIITSIYLRYFGHGSFGHSSCRMLPIGINWNQLRDFFDMSTGCCPSFEWLSWQTY